MGAAKTTSGEPPTATPLTTARTPSVTSTLDPLTLTVVLLLFIVLLLFMWIVYFGMGKGYQEPAHVSIWIGGARGQSTPRLHSWTNVNARRCPPAQRSAAFFAVTRTT